jgi:hypothetical protein
MNLPFILDVALGLIFVYLILSLLASEIQELIAALLQWRAKHLRGSVTNLLAGGQEPPKNEQKQVRELVDKIYNDPLIQNINQASIQGVASLFRQTTWAFGDCLNWLFGIFHKRNQGRISRNNQRSAPSYIPAETFATTLIESIGILDLSRLLMQKRLEKFKARLTEVVEGTLQKICEQESVKGRSSKFDDELKQIVKNHGDCEADVKTCISRMMESLDRLAAYLKEYPGDCNHEAFHELQAIKANYFGEKGERAFLFGLQPSASELIELTDKGSRVYREMKPLFEDILKKDSIGAKAAQKVDAETLKAMINEDPQGYKIAQEVDLKIVEIAKKKPDDDLEKITLDVIESLKKADRRTYEIYRSKEETYRSQIIEKLPEPDRRTYEIYRNFQQIDQVIDGLPKFVKDSLRVLARRAESRMQQIGFHTQEVGNEVDHLRREIEYWFNRSMDRASGVYKRNSKGFALILGITIAVVTNSDTFHLFNRISNDEKLRQVIVQNATAISQKNDSSKLGYDAVKEATDKALKDIPLPIGWNPKIVKEQLNCNKTGDSWTSIYECDSFRNPFRNGTKQETSFFVPGKIIGMMANSWHSITMLMGWLVSGIAIAMGAPFWFDILNKVVNVRNTGKPPESSTTGQTTSSSNPSAPGS